MQSEPTETEFTTNVDVILKTGTEEIQRFTTLLQAGILISCPHGTAIGTFLTSLPDFSPEYITRDVQTIFLDGTATDDMETPLTGQHPVLAISAAMPGLAGAIFRRNSLHAALRTVSMKPEQDDTASWITVTLKLFNAIARDKGVTLLTAGVDCKAASLAEFLANRPPVAALIQEASVNGEQVRPEALGARLDACTDIHLKLTS